MTKPTRGGARKGAGRKPIGDVAMKRHQVFLSEAHVKKARKIGLGSVSKGLRDAVDRIVPTED